MFLLRWSILAWCLATVFSQIIDFDNLPPRHAEFVYGVDLAMTGATGAVSFPNGTCKELASVQGGEAYTKLMSDWYRLMTGEEEKLIEYAQRNREEMRRINKLQSAFLDESQDSWLDWFQYKIGWKQRDFEYLYSLDHYPGDQATQVLAEVFTEIKASAVAALNISHASGQATRPYVEISVPAWFFKLVSILDTVLVDAKAASPLTRKISTAAHRGGFRRSVDNDPRTIVEHMERGDRVDGPVAAPIAELERVLMRPCDPERFGDGYCSEHRVERVIGPGAVVNWDRTDMGSLVTLWVDDMTSGFHGGASWTFWTLPSETKSFDPEAKTTFAAVSSTLVVAMSQLGKMIDGFKAPLILTGPLWTDDAVDLLRGALVDQVSSLELLRPSRAQGAINTAEEASRFYRTNDVCYTPVEPLRPIKVHKEKARNEL